MTRKRIAWRLAGVLMGLLLIAGVSAVFVARSSWFYEKVRQWIVGTVETATGGRVEVGSFNLDWKQLRAEVKEFVIHGTEPAGKPPLFRAASATVVLKLVSVFKQDVDIQSVDVVNPRVYLIIDSDGRTNVPAPKLKATRGRSTMEDILKLAIRRFSLQQGMFEVETRGRTPFDARGQNLNANLSYDLTGPRYRARIAVQPLVVTWSDYAPVPFGVELAVTLEKNRIGLDSAKLSTGGTHVELSGAVEDLAQNANAGPHAKLRYDARVSIADVGRIFRVDELKRGAAQVGGEAVWTPSGGVSLTGNLHATGVEFRDTFLHLADFRADGAVTAGVHGVNANGLRLSGSYLNLDRRAPVEGRIAEVGVRGKNVDLRGVELSVMGGSFRGDAQVRELDRYAVNGEVSGIEARRVVAMYSRETLPWDARAFGPVHLEGSFRRSQELRATANLTIAPALTGLPVSGRIAAGYEVRSGILDLGRSTLTLPHSQADFSGAFGRELQVHLETRDLNDILPVLGRSAATLPLKLRNGAAIFDGTVTGKLESPHIAGHVSATDFSYAGESVDSLEADVAVSPENLQMRNASIARGSLRAQFQGGVGLSDWDVPDSSSIAASGSIRNAPLADLVAVLHSKVAGVSGTLSGDAQVDGTVGSPRVQADAEILKGRVQDELFDRLAGHVAYSGNTVEVSAAQLAAGTKQVRMSATFNHAPNRFDAGRLRFQVSSNAMPLEQIGTLQAARPGAKGTVQLTASGDLEIAPSANQPYRIADLHADVSAMGLQLDGQQLGDARLTANSQGQVLRAHLESSVANSTVRGDGEWRMTGDYPGSATVAFSKFDFNRLRDWIAPAQSAQPLRFSGSVEGDLRVEGPLMHWQAMKAELRIPKFEMAPAPESGPAAASLAIRNSSPIVIRYASPAITVESAHLTGRGTDLNVTGRVLPEQKSPLDLRVDGHIDLGLLQDLNPDYVSSGTLITSATVRGSLSEPQINGRMEFQKAAFNIADVPNGISNATGVVIFNKDRVTIQSLTGETGGGSVELTGFASYGPGPIVFRIHVRASEVRVRYPEGVSTVANAFLNLTGTAESSMLSGTVSILRTGINLQSDLSSILAKSAEPVRTPSVQPGLLGGMSFDVQIETAPDIQVQSTLTENIQVEANLHLRGTASNPALLGRINITQGKLAFFGTQYTLNQGSIAFFNPVKVEPVLNIDLETKARGIDITLTVSGPLNKLTLTPRSDPPLQFNEIVALLATGRTPTSDPSLLTRQSSSPQSFQQMGASALLGSAIANPVAGRLQRFFGVSKLRIDPTLSGVENNPQARLTLEQQVTPSLTFTYITNVTSSNPQVVRVEWAFSRQWSAVALREENGLFGLDFLYKRRFK